jgi:superfamily II DNA or RNA helicase
VTHAQASLFSGRSAEPPRLTRAAPPELRPYQREALYGGKGFPGIFKRLNEHRAALLVLPTGCGKTLVFAKVAESRVRRQGRVLVLAHRTELIEQAANRLLSDTDLVEGDIGIEQASRRALDSAHVWVASVATLRGKRLERLPPDYFGTIITDEAHHAPAKTYRGIYERFPKAERLGVTATPDRLDGAGLFSLFGGLAYVYEIRDAINDRYLVPIRARMVFVDSIDLSQVTSHHGDLDEGQLEDVLLQQEALHGIAKPTVELSGERTTLVFANGVQHAHQLAAVINGYAPGQAVALDGDTDDAVRRVTLRDYLRGQFRYLVNCALFTEGVDLPPVSCIVMARPTESRALYAQMAGRGTRLLGRTLEDSIAAGKSDCLILDMVGNAGRHRLVCALDVLDSGIDEAVKKRAWAKAAEGDVDVMAALEQAAHEEMVQQRLDIVAKVRYRVVEVDDQVALLGVRPRAGRWGGAEITGPQLEVLKRAKIKGAEKLDRGQASEVIDALKSRRQAGLCTLPQAGILLRHGLNPDVTFERASLIIDSIIKNRWHVPPELLQDPTLVLSAETMAEKRKALGV